MIFSMMVALKAHADQTYDGGPYIYHPLRVAKAVPFMYHRIAILHDVLEDSDLDLPDHLYLWERQAIHILTRRPSQSYVDYIDRLMESNAVGAPQAARIVKIADLNDNLAHTPRPSHATRYQKALERLAV